MVGTQLDGRAAGLVVGSLGHLGYLTREAPSHFAYAYPKNLPQINVAWIPAAEAAVD